MAVKVTVKAVGSREGANVSVPYLGKFKNGESTEVPQDRWERFLNHSPGAREAYEGQTDVTIGHSNTVESESESESEPKPKTKSKKSKASSEPEPSDETVSNDDASEDE